MGIGLGLLVAGATAVQLASKCVNVAYNYKVYKGERPARSMRAGYPGAKLSDLKALRKREK